LIHFIDRPFRIGPMLARPRAAAGMVRNFDQWKFGDSKKFRLRATQLHEDRLAERHRRFAFLL
jgi:hypothetical protein